MLNYNTSNRKQEKNLPDLWLGRDLRSGTKNTIHKNGS